MGYFVAFQKISLKSKVKKYTRKFYKSLCHWKVKFNYNFTLIRLNEVSLNNELSHLFFIY